VTSPMTKLVHRSPSGSHPYNEGCMCCHLFEGRMSSQNQKQMPQPVLEPPDQDYNIIFLYSQASLYFFFV